MIPTAGVRLGLPATAAFWTAYILTRPFGASIADWLAVSRARGGLDLGHLPITGVGMTLIAAGVLVMQVRAGRANRYGIRPEETMSLAP